MSVQDNNSPKKDLAKFRKLIRKQVAKILKGKTAAGKNVFPNSTVPPWEEELPVILIYPKTETITEYAQAPRELTRDLDLIIEIIAAGPEVDEDGNPPIGKKSLDDILDDLADEVECEMSRDETLGGTADDSILTGIDFEFDGGGGQPIGALRLTFGVSYNTMFPRSVDKQGGLSDLKTVQADYNIGDDENTREAKDTIDIPTT